ncbi:MFS transporter [Shewanella morhuae]|uniref:MFS transporter n=1 Tax=Shewanella morhuae TaxID=365591 RepID=A0ABX5HYW9_9GAMM|nr:MFS transporter [Shewanella morhuae]PTA51479.1 MFS transporter [Shewanella morhuae]
MSTVRKQVVQHQHKGASIFWVILALALGTFALGTTEFASMTLVPYIASDLGVDVAQVSYAISAYALGVVIGSPIIMVLAVRVRRRTLLIALATLMALANGLSALAPSLNWLIFFRFLSGLPHGAYFGVAMLLAASLVPPEMKARAVSRVFIGLTLATIIGVPFATWMGQTVGWRSGIGIVAILATITALLVYFLAPNQAVADNASPKKELQTLKNREVWLTLGIAAIGFGGIFCVYTYLAETLIQVTQVEPFKIPIMMAVFGIGATLGTLVCGWAADKSALAAAFWSLVLSTVVLAIYPSVTGNYWALIPVVFFIGCGLGLATIVQARLMDVAPDGQTMTGALVQCAFNLANAIGPWVGSLVILSGQGIAATGYAAALLSLGGLVMWWLTHRESRRAVSLKVNLNPSPAKCTD